MAVIEHIRAFAIISLLATNAVGEKIANQPVVEWLRGSGKDLQICLKGEVFESDGQPAANVQVTGGIKASVASHQLAPSMDGHRFKIWVPVNQPDWYSLWLKAGSASNDHVACKTVSQYELRQAAIDGLKLRLQAPTRHVDVTVTDKGQPVAGAKVKAEIGFGADMHSITNANGIARFDLFPRQELQQLTAWTNDYRIGGYSFNGSPPRDPNVDAYVVELSKCRDQKLRFVDERGAPVPDIKFAIQIATAPPNYNFIGSNDHSRMTTDAGGEAVYRWFPDWDTAHYYADIGHGPWVLDGYEPKVVDGVAIFNLKKGKARKNIKGRVASASTGAGGFAVRLYSFQGERTRNSDVLSTFTDPDGSFALDVLPDATYCAFLIDSRWVGKVIDLIPYQTATEKLTSPELSVTEGQEVEVLVTSGPKKQPVPNLTVSFERNHHFTWREKGETKSGVVGPQWWATTNESGIATTRTLPGELEVSVYTPRWHTEKTVNIPSGERMKIQLQRKIDEKRIVTGRLVLDPGVSTSLVGAVIQIGSVDSNYEDEQTLTCTKDGAFAFATFADAIGIVGSTHDGQAAGLKVVNDLDAPIEVRLRPTSDYLGKLLGEDNLPVANRRVIAVVQLEGKKGPGSRFPKSFTAKRFDTTTDSEGNFTFRGIPSQIKVDVYTFVGDLSNHIVSFGPLYFEQGESRPRTISRLPNAAKDRDNIPLAERFKETLRDCALSGFRPMLIVAGGGKGVSRFVNQNYTNWNMNKDIYSFLQITTPGNAQSLEPADAAFLKERNWPMPQEGHVVAVAFDDQGKELGRLDSDIRHPEAAGEVADFIHRQLPITEDAEAKWNAAFAEAKQSNRRVWVRLCQRNFSPCFQLARWLDDERELLNKDYVMLKLDNIRDQNAARVVERITHGELYGVYAIFDSSGKMLIDSKGPLDNIAYPNNIEGKKHLRKMLLATRQNLSDAEIDHLVESVRK
jgi:hypothetical protein